MNLFNAYDILGVHPECSDVEIKSRHRILSNIHHPDKEGGDQVRFMEVQEAFRAIKGPEARKLLATRLMGLGDKCAVCDGKGVVRKQRNFGRTTIKTRCETCKGCGYIERAQK